MSTTAVRDVTRALQKLLLSQLTSVGGNTVQVSLLPPGEAMPSGLGVNLYLYRVTQSPYTRNQPWAGDKAPTPGTPGPVLGLELSYLLTPFAPAPDASSSAGDDAHTMLGAAMLAFYQAPILNDAHLVGFDADAELSPALLNSFEQVKIRLMTTSLDELSKIWATINQPYRLSVAYDVSLVELTPDVVAPTNTSMVMSTGLDVRTMGLPRIDALTPSTGALAQVNGAGNLVANTLTISGGQFTLPGQMPVVMVGGQMAVINSAPAATDTALSVQLPVTPDAGPSENVTVMLSGLTSAARPFTVLPWLDRITPLRTALDGAGATTLALAGIGFTTAPSGVRLDGPGGTTNVTTFAGAVTDTTATIDLPGTLANGLYQVRVILAAPDHLATNSRTLEVIPLLASPVVVAEVTVAGVQVHQLTLNGKRLAGTTIVLSIDGVKYQAAANANATQIVFTMSRLLSAGQHSVAVSIDGGQSHSVTVVI
jgi:hypothetical protein